MQNTYLPDTAWFELAANLTNAATHPIDPETAIKEALASAGIMPEMCREDCEVSEAA
ncbi:hypothetical protein [Celeribacter sp.]|uniref:hypothetical protein n=1 Tax=Celeribacter sp. TaxID=1890673 RepID=UPI003A8F0520